MSITQPDFNKIFASGATTGEVLQWPEASFLRGWGYLQQDEPPPMEFFNALQQLNDTKAQYLFKAGNIRENNKQYSVGDIVTSPNLPSRYSLKCTVEGTTAVNEPTFSSVSNGLLVTDGSCQWMVKDKLGGNVVVQQSVPTNQGEGDVWIETT